MKEKSLLKANENSIFYKIKSFFKDLFYKSKDIQNDVILEQNINNNVESEEKESAFIKSIRNIENEETLILKLQEQFRRGEIKEEDLTEEQVNLLCSLYDSQIANLKKSNRIRKQRLLEYRRKMQKNA